MGNKNYNNNDIKAMKNNEIFSQYKLIFHFPINQSDCINSIDIFDDKIAIGTIMGDAYLLRVDDNNLDVKDYQNKPVLNDNPDSEKNNLISREGSTKRNKRPIIKLSKNENGEKNQNNYINKKLDKKENEKEDKTMDDTDDISKIKHELKRIKMIRLNNNLDESLHQNGNFTVTKKRNNKQKNIIIQNGEKKMSNNNMKDVTNVDDEEEEENENNKEKTSNDKLLNKEKSNQSNNNEKDNLYKVTKFPQISKLVEAANENICCIHFDTEKILNISIGDFEILRIKDVHKYNMNDPSSSYIYAKIKNYDYADKHFKYCENAICMMNSSNFLIIFSNFVNFASELKQEKYRYNNINLIKENKIQGKIQMYNFSIPFDFDGEDFLFLEYTSKGERNICLFNTVDNEYFYKYKIEQSFGHISHMKILNNKDKKIFLCRNDLHCEIHSLDEEFTCIESFEHIGNDIINIFIYFKESKLSDEFKQKIFEEKNKNGSNLNNNNYEDYVKINNNNKSKSIIKINSENSNRSKNNEKMTLEKKGDFNNNYNILNINISKSIKNKPYKTQKDIQLSLEEDSENSSKKDRNSQDKSINSKNSSIQIFNKSKKIEEESKESIKEDKHSEKNNKNKKKREASNLKNNTDREKTIDIEEKNEIVNYYIFIIDNNGNLNMYKNKKNRTLFNLYNIEGIDQSYKEKKFFSVGYPYYLAINELYFAITTDLGLFVISNNNKEF